MLVVYLVEAFEYFALFVERNAVSRIFDLEKQFMVLFFQCNGDAFAFTGIFKGIGQQVVYDKLHVIRVA